MLAARTACNGCGLYRAVGSIEILDRRGAKGRDSFFRRRMLIGRSAVTSCAADKRESVVQVIVPPEEYDMRVETAEATRRVVESEFASLMDLVENGTLVVVVKPDNYVERRTDGYREPEVIFMVGTAHVSKQSAEDVRRVIAAVRPDNVVVELCRSRAGIMYDEPAEMSDGEVGGLDKSSGNDAGSRNPNLMSLSGQSFGSAIARTLTLGGNTALALRLLLAGMSQRISASTGVQSGTEFRAARQAAEDVGAQIVLGDRPIEITLQRAWGALGLVEKVRLAGALLNATWQPSVDPAAAIRQLESDAALSAVFREMGARFPSLMQPLVHERDVYLAWSMKRSKAVNGCRRVVGVLGRGHLRGVAYALTHDQGRLRFRDLVARGSDAGSSNEDNMFRSRKAFAKRVAFEAVLGIVLWYLWEAFSGGQ